MIPASYQNKQMTQKWGKPTRKVLKDKKEHYIMIKELILQEDITIINV